MSEVSVTKEQGGVKREPFELGRYEGTSPAAPLSRFFGMSPFGTSPLGWMRHLTGEMDRFVRGWGDGKEAGEWVPAIDVQQCGGNLVVSAELPGMKKEDVKVEMTDDALIIEGERKQEHKTDHEGYHRFERSYGRFCRSLALPEGAQTEQVKAELRNGVLKVSIPVAETRKKLRQVPILEDGAKTTPATAARNPIQATLTSQFFERLGMHLSVCVEPLSTDPL